MAFKMRSKLSLNYSERMSLRLFLERVCVRDTLCVFMFVMHINTIVTFLITLSVRMNEQANEREREKSICQDPFCIRYLSVKRTYIDLVFCFVDGFKYSSSMFRCVDVTLKEIISLLNIILLNVRFGFRLVICNTSRML